MLFIVDEAAFDERPSPFGLKPSLANQILYAPVRKAFILLLALILKHFLPDFFDFAS